MYHFSIQNQSWIIRFSLYRMGLHSPRKKKCPEVSFGTKSVAKLLSDAKHLGIMLHLWESSLIQFWWGFKIQTCSSTFEDKLILLKLLQDLKIDSDPKMNMLQKFSSVHLSHLSQLLLSPAALPGITCYFLI